MGKLRLYHYWRSSCSWRVRWAFSLKKIPCEFVAVDLLKEQNLETDHISRNPTGFVPVLEIVDSKNRFFLGESLAIIEWAEEKWPTPSLLPEDTLLRARTRELAYIIASGTQPLQNLAAQKKHSSVAEEKKEWARFWIRRGLAAYEKRVVLLAGDYSVNSSLSLADLCLIPQCYNAERFDVSLDDFPTIQRIYHNARQTKECQETSPEKYAP